MIGMMFNNKKATPTPVMAPTWSYLKNDGKTWEPYQSYQNAQLNNAYDHGPVQFVLNTDGGVAATIDFTKLTQKRNGSTRQIQRYPLAVKKAAAAPGAKARPLLAPRVVQGQPLAVPAAVPAPRVRPQVVNVAYANVEPVAPRPRPQPPSGTWCFKNTKGDWRRYGAIYSEELERAYLNAQPELTLAMVNNYGTEDTYRIDFRTMRQYNLVRGNFMREIRREIPLIA